MNRILTHIIRENSNISPDFSEKLGNIGLGLLRIGFGTVLVLKVSPDSNFKFEKKLFSLCTRIVAIALFIFALPLTLLLAGTGCIGTFCSRTHSQTLDLHKMVSEAKNKNNERIENAQINIPQVRAIPPVSIMDTQRAPGVSVHGTTELFKDNEIVEKLDIIRREKIVMDSKVFVSYTKHGKAIIQQQATRGCTAATAAMLIVDHGKQPDLQVLRMRNLGNDENQVRDIKAAGLNPVINTANTLKELQNLIQKNGSAVVTVIEDAGFHVVVVDAVSADFSKIRLRDPYHGWEITVTQKAFLREWNKGRAIQIAA